MKHIKNTFNYNKIIPAILAMSAFVLWTGLPCQSYGAVAARPTTNAPKASRAPSSKTAQISTASKSASIVSNPTNNTETEYTDETYINASDEPDEDIIIEDKTSQFSSVLDTYTNNSLDSSTQSLADMIRQQRATLDAAAAEEFSRHESSGNSMGLSSCDTGLRQCMATKCGTNFVGCAGDGDTVWGEKMDSCRRNINCSANEYRQFAAEIKADRDMNKSIEMYQKIIDCGNTYNACIEDACGPSFNKCLGKAAGDNAIAKCEKIANDCKQQDSGLAARTMSVFGTLRQAAEEQIKSDEDYLYTLRDKMSSTCNRLGDRVTLDRRSLDCVYSVEFWAGDEFTTPTASKQLYAGSSFDCEPEWFGIDVTTFKENAYRLTREQKSASASMLGAGAGIATGSITSGAIDRAIDVKKAKDALKKAEKEDGEASLLDILGNSNALKKFAKENNLDVNDVDAIKKWVKKNPTKAFDFIKSNQNLLKGNSPTPAGEASTTGSGNNSAPANQTNSTQGNSKADKSAKANKKSKSGKK